MDEFFTRAQIVKLHFDKLHSEATQLADDALRGIVNAEVAADRMRVLRDEMDVCNESLRVIREEQLIAQLPKPKVKKKRWWRRG